MEKRRRQSLNENYKRRKRKVRSDGRSEGGPIEVKEKQKRRERRRYMEKRGKGVQRRIVLG